MRWLKCGSGSRENSSGPLKKSHSPCCSRTVPLGLKGANGHDRERQNIKPVMVRCSGPSSIQKTLSDLTFASTDTDGHQHTQQGIVPHRLLEVASSRECQRNQPGSPPADEDRWSQEVMLSISFWVWVWVCVCVCVCFCVCVCVCVSVWVRIWAWVCVSSHNDFGRRSTKCLCEGGRVVIRSGTESGEYAAAMGRSKGCTRRARRRGKGLGGVLLV